MGIEKTITIRRPGTTNPKAIVITDEKLEELDAGYEMKYGFRYIYGNKVYAIFMHTTTLTLYAVKCLDAGLMSDERDVVNLGSVLRMGL